MPRRKNTRPTRIYWLIDMRPDVLTQWPQGLPFYCGKTVLPLSQRLAMHLHDKKRYENRPSCVRLSECGNCFRIVEMAVVAPDESWSAAEKWWISVLRNHFPGCVNVTSGGQGAPGNIHSASTRAKMSAAKRGKPVLVEHRAKISAALKGRTLSADIRAKMSESRTGKSLSAAHRAATSAGRKGIVFSAEQIANMRNAQTGKKQSAETIEKKAAACRGQKRSPETRARISAALRGKKLSKERCAAMSVTRLGRKHSLETRIKMSNAQKARRNIEALA